MGKNTRPPQGHHNDERANTMTSSIYYGKGKERYWELNYYMLLRVYKLLALFIKE